MAQFSMSGFTFPCTAMSPTLQALSNIFPLRHFYLLYCNQALNGYPQAYAYASFVGLLIMLLLPPLVLPLLREHMENGVYTP